MGSERPSSEGSDAMLTDPPPEPEAISDDSASVVNAPEPEIDSSDVEPSSFTSGVEATSEADSSSEEDEESDGPEVEDEEIE